MKGNWKGYRGTGLDQIVNLKCEVNERLVCVLTYYGTLEKRSRSLVILVITPYLNAAPKRVLQSSPWPMSSS